MAVALRKLRQILFDATDTQGVLDRVAQFLTAELFADRVIIHDLESGLRCALAAGQEHPTEREDPAIFSAEFGRLRFQDQTFTGPVIISNSSTSRLYQTLEPVLRRRSIRSFAAVPLFRGEQIGGVIEIHYCELYQRWQRSDLALLEHLADLAGWALDRVAESSRLMRPQLPAVQPSTGASEQRAQDRRIQALYELSRSLTIDLDPAIVALRGLRSLLKATGSAAGVCVFLDPSQKRLELVAADGVSARYAELLGAQVNQRSLLKLSVDRGESFCIPDLKTDPRAATAIACEEGLGAAIVVPLIYDDMVYGALGVFHRDTRQFSDDDFQLVSAAAHQICLIARQAEYYSNEKRNAQSLLALYRLTHELSKYFSAKEVAEHAFPVIQEQVPCKRMWLATLNEQGTHLVGQAGFGPGMRQRIVNLQIQRAQPHQFLDQALESRIPVIVPAGQEMECSGLRMLVRRLELGTLVILPLISLGQAVGVLLLEPENPSPQAAQSALGLLSRMAGEIGTVILARRFESRMASDDKMRTASLIASGVAHNFNNLLQAIMGQSSLIEMQLPKDSPLVRSAQLIVESSHRGAGLIKQLVACTVGENQNIERIDLRAMIDDSRDFYRSILGSPILLTVEVGDKLPSVSVDYGRVQQTIANILVHAKDAIGQRTDGEVSLSVSRVEIDAVESASELLPGTYAQIRIVDNGASLDGEQQGRIFEPFFALYNEDPRNQIGGVAHVNLSTSYALIRNYGGTITLANRDTGGSEFTILIPEASLRDNSRRERAERVAITREPAVLMLDVEDSVTTSVSALVDSLGLSAASLRKRQRVREMLEAHQRSVRVVMIDTDRSAEDLVGFVREIVAGSPHVRILISTFDPKRWSRLLQGVEHIEMLPKPLSIWALDKVMRQVVQAAEVSPLARQVERSSDRRAGSKSPGGTLSTSTRKLGDEQ